MKAGDRVLLALGGGSARGIAHIGVIDALEAAGLEIAGVAGTSIGSVVGGAYCAGALGPYGEFMSTIGRRGVLGMLDPVLPRGGLFAGKRLSDLMRSFVGDVHVEDLEVPFCAVAVDVSGGDEVRLRSGDLVKAMRASFGIPGLFTPLALEVEGTRRWLVDGGVASPVPVMAARELGDLPIVAVNVNRGFAQPRIQRKPAPMPEDDGPSARKRLAALLDGDHVPRAARDFLRGFFESSNDKSEDAADPEQDSRGGFLSRWFDLFSREDANAKRPGMVDSLYNSVLLLQHHLARSQFLAEPPALLIEPNMEGVGLFDYHLGGLLIEEGARATREALDAS